MRDRLENSAQRIAVLQNFIDFAFHPLFRFPVGAVQQDFVLTVKRFDFFPGDLVCQSHVADRDHVTQDFDAQLTQEYLGERPNGHTRRRLAGRSSLEDVTSFRKIIFQSARQVGVPRPWRRHPLVPRGIAFADRQRLLPVFPIFILQLDGNRRTNRNAVMHSGKYVSRIPLDLHAPAAAVALLPAPQLAIHKRLIYLKPGGQPRQKGDECFAVRLPRCEVTQHSCSILPDAPRLPLSGRETKLKIKTESAKKRHFLALQPTQQQE